MHGDDLLYSDEHFLKFEDLLSRNRPQTDDVWEHRATLFSSLTSPSFKAEEKKFKLGFVSYFAWLLLTILRTRPLRVKASPPAADFLVHMVGDVSKEVDTLVPVACALRDAGHSVLVLWAPYDPLPGAVLDDLRGCNIWIPPSKIEFAAPRSLLIRDILSTCRLLFRAAFYLRSLKGIWTAFFKRGAFWFHHIFFLTRWERFLASALPQHKFKGVAVVSEAAYSALAVCRTAIENTWPAHHFWHGLPGLTIHARCISTHLYCFSQADRNFFIRNQWPARRVHANGHPRQTRLAAQVRNLRTTSPVEGGLRVLFASQPGWEGGFGLKQYRDTVEAVLQTAKTLGLTVDEFRVRLHPAEDSTVYFEVANEHMPHLSRTLLSASSVAEDLAWANVVVTPFSTMAIEACYAECVLIWIITGDFFTKVGEDLVEGGFGHKATCARELGEQLSICRDPARRSQLINEFVRTGRELGVINEKAAATAAEMMIRFSDNWQEAHGI